MWAGIIASVLERDLIVYPDSGIAAAFGAARLARLCATGEPAAEVCRPPERGEVITADPRFAGEYRTRHAAFRGLYAALRQNFRPG